MATESLKLYERCGKWTSVARYLCRSGAQLVRRGAAAQVELTFY